MADEDEDEEQRFPAVVDLMHTIRRMVRMAPPRFWRDSFVNRRSRLATVSATKEFLIGLQDPRAGTKIIGPKSKEPGVASQESESIVS